MAKSVRGAEGVLWTPGRDLCGLDNDEFADLLVALAPLEIADRDARAQRPGRRRAPGAGRKPYPFGFRLLVGVTHLWLGLSVRKTAAIFRVHEHTVRVWRDETIRLLVAHGPVLPGAAGPVRNENELLEHLKAKADDEFAYVVIDGTCVPRPRPGGDWAAQRSAWSGKAHDHVVKASVLADEDGNPLWWEANPSGQGRTHDIAMLRDQSLLLVLALAGITLLGDLGYEGLHHDLGDDDVWVPRRRRPGRRLDRDSRIYNHALAVSRVRVEHAIAKLKRWGALTRHRRAPNTFDDLGKAIVVLEAFRRR